MQKLKPTIPYIVLFLAVITASPLHAQIFFTQTGANRSDVSWHQIETGHFIIVYHDGLDSAAREAADMAEAIYPVVTGNLRTELAGRTTIYLSDLDEVQNAFAYADRFIFIWMRGLLDDAEFGGVRASGHAKWLRTVITHEFTHTVIAHAIATWPGALIPIIDAFAVPRWFNEGTARFMEPDGWTTDIDMVLRVAAVNGGLTYDLMLDPDVIDGTLLYETGHSIVRYMTQRFGDSTIARILQLGRSPLGYDFGEGVQQATGMTMGEIYRDWFRTVTALYGAEYAVRPEAGDIAPAVLPGFQAVTGIRYSPDRSMIAVLGGDLGVLPESQGQRLYLIKNDSTGEAVRLIDDPAIEQNFSWSPDGGRLVISKLRRGGHRELLHDLYIVDVANRSLARLTTDANLADPAWSPDGARIVAVRKRLGRDNLVAIDPATGAEHDLTAFTGDVQISTPSWSPDGRRIAFGMFDTDGTRAIATVNADGSGLARLVADTANNRYPVWSPDGTRIAFTSHTSGVPNLVVMNADGTGRHFVTDVAGGIYSVQWMPHTDSIVAISLDTRRSAMPHLVPANGHVARLIADPQILPKYTAWRAVSFGRHVPPPDSIPRAVTGQPESYCSIAHVFPVVPLLPQLAPDRDRNGAQGGVRAGLVTAWSDPMTRHVIVGSLDYGFASRQWGGELYYLDNATPITFTLHGRNTLGYERELYGRGYYQRTRSLSMEASYTLPAPNDLSVVHLFRLGAGYRDLSRWTLSRTVSMDPDSLWDTGGDALHGNAPPLDAELYEVGAGYRYTSRTFMAQGNYTRSVGLSDKGVEYDRLSAVLSARYPLFGSESQAILARAEGAAQWGRQLPQEPIALVDAQVVSPRWLAIPDLMRGPTSYTVRGMRGSVPGDRVLVASVALETRLGIFEEYLPILSLFRPQTVVFVETGSAWFDANGGIASARFHTGYGAELRASILPRLWVSLGLAGSTDRRFWALDPYSRITFGL